MVRLLCIFVLLCAAQICAAQSFKIVKKFTHPDRGTSLQTARAYGSTILSVIIHQDTMLFYTINGVRTAENKMILLYGDSSDLNFSGRVINQRNTSFSGLGSDINNLRYFGNETYNTGINSGGGFYIDLTPVGQVVRKNYFTFNTFHFIMDGFEMKDGSMLMCGQDFSTTSGRSDPFYMIIGTNGLLKYMHTDIDPSGIQGFYNKGYELANKELVFIRTISTAYLAEFFDSTGVKYRTDTITMAPGPNFALFGPLFTFSPDSCIISAAYCFNPITREQFCLLSKYNYFTRQFMWRKNMGRNSIGPLYVNSDNYLYFERLNDDSSKYEFVVMKDTVELFKQRLIDTVARQFSYYIRGFVPYDDSTTIAYSTDFKQSSYASWLFIKGMGRQFNPITLSPALWHGSGSKTGRLSFYPNPAQEHVVVQPPHDEPITSLQCHDMQGRLLWQRSHLDIISPERVTIQQPAGIYTLRATTTSGKQLVGRLVVR